jgi:hypothetical protein
MALLLLCQFLQEIGKPEYVEMLIGWVNQNQATKNFGQGPLMGSVESGFSR